MNDKHKHLEFIQTVVARMAQNTFYLKGWSITVVGAFLSFYDKTKTPHFVGYFFAVILGTFWVSGGYFLKEERLFRQLYDKVRVAEQANIDFSMSTKLLSKRSDIFKAMFSFSQVIFFVPLIIVATLTVFLLK
jgi:uncharacterized membrane protein